MHPVRHVVEYRCPSHDRVVLWLHAVEARRPRRGSNSPSTTRHPLRSTGSGRAVPPLHSYYGTLRLPDSLLASLRCLRLAIPRSTWFSSPLASGAKPTDRPGVCCTGCSKSGLLRGTARISHVPEKPVRSFAMFLRPRCDQARWWVQVSLMPGSAPATVNDEGSRQGNFGAHSHIV